MLSPSLFSWEGLYPRRRRRGEQRTGDAPEPQQRERAAEQE
jgi:hypothetical protein